MSSDDVTTPGAGDGSLAVRGLRALVVEGSEEGRRSLGVLLRSFGMEPTLMAQAQTAIEELRRAAREGQPYALLLFDSTLRGSVVFRARRSHDDPQFAITPRIELGPEARPGADAFERGPLLQKPVTRRSLLTALDQVLGSGAPVPSRPRVPPLAKEYAPRVLLMEADPVSALIGARLVELAGGAPVVANSLAEAVAAVESVDAALLDAAGPEAAMRVEGLRRARPGLRLLGLIQGSPAGVTPADGFDAYLDATLDPDDLRAQLMQPRTDEAAAPATQPETPLFDRRRLAGRLGDDNGAAERVLQRFVEQAEALLHDLGKAVDSTDAHAIGQQAHRLRGSLAWIGAERAARLAADVEELCLALETARAAELCQTLRQETERVVAAIRGGPELPTA